MTQGEDPRHITTGWEIPTASYSDQPYIVQTDDGAWLCCVTTGAGEEGAPGQIVTTLRSLDRGRTWSAPVAVEPAGGPEASYAVMLKVPSGRVYIFYNHNSDNIREIPADPSPWLPDGRCKRVDSLGYFVFKYSDDHGRTWSQARCPIPVREMQIDRENPHGGEIRYFWNVGKPFIHAGAAFVSLHKVGRIGDGFFVLSEGVLLKSASLLTERDPTRIAWETLPDGDAGLRTPPGGGSVAEEQSYSVLSDGSFFCVYRSIDGHPVCSYSRDGGHTWSVPEYMRFADGRLMKHPRAANFAWKCRNGKFLYWFHNHGGRFIREHPQRRTNAYEDRNPVWLCGGVEADSPQGRIIRWSQPEIVLYDDDPYVRISYPDLVEAGGEIFLTETQKNNARVHRLDPGMLAGLWAQLDGGGAPAEGAGLDFAAAQNEMPARVPLPPLPDFTRRDAHRADYGELDLRAGFTLDLLLTLESLQEGQVLLDNRTTEGKGFCLWTKPRGTLELLLNDGRSQSSWDCEPGELAAGKPQSVCVIVDGGPKLILFVIDGRLNDGGDARQFGWGRFNPQYRGPAGAEQLFVSPTVARLRIYPRALRVSEAVVNQQKMS
jgi:hypothetical protein